MQFFVDVSYNIMMQVNNKVTKGVYRLIIHVVQRGDSIYKIARKYGVSPLKIIEDNELLNPEQLVVGQTIVIVKDNMDYIIQRGDSLYSIALKFGVRVQDILEANPQLDIGDIIYPGQKIVIPLNEPKYGSILVNGYAFPNISMEVLRKTLKNLTFLSIFSYEVKPNGTLSEINDGPLIAAAKNAKVAPFMVITNLEEGGGFSSELAKTILTNKEVQNNLLDNVERILEQKGYYGLDIDFEFIYPENREDYNNFLRTVASRFKPLGYQITTAVAPKTSADQKGLLYEAHDYAVHGALSDHVIIMTYEWGYTYGPALPVAPVNEVRKVINYAVTAIPSNKILMGIPNYGYDWTLPFVKGTAAESISNTKAVDRAREFNAAIKYDRQAQAPYYNYYDANRKQHEVWFEDARSIKAKLELVNQYNLGGVSYWTITNYFPQNWLVLSSLFDIKKVL